MNVIQEISKTVKQIADVICNRCGRSCRDPASGGIFAARAEAFGGYGSRRFADMHRYRFDLCEDCTIEVARTFKHPPEVRMVGLSGHGDGEPEVAWEAIVGGKPPV